MRSVAVVTSGNAGAQAITLASAPFITRLYGPEAFGVLGAYMAVVTIASPVVALAYPRITSYNVCYTKLLRSFAGRT